MAHNGPRIAEGSPRFIEERNKERGDRSRKKTGGLLAIHLLAAVRVMCRVFFEFLGPLDRHQGDAGVEERNGHIPSTSS